MKQLVLWLKNPSFRKRALRFTFFYLFPFRAKDIFAEIALSDNEAIAGTGRALVAFSQTREQEGLEKIETLRQKLIKNKARLSFPDYGAGGNGRSKIKKATVSKICKRTSKDSRWAMLLYLLVKELKPESCLELGSALGISSAYIGEALKENNKGKLITIEGAPPLTEIATENIKYLKLDEIVTLKNGTFDEVLPQVLTNGNLFDLVFIDGHHQGEATLHYFELIRLHLNSGAVIVFDDIYYSEDMLAAWEQIKKERYFKLVVDLGQFGICLYTASSSFKPIKITC